MNGTVTDTVIVSGGNIQKDFALDFLKKLMENSDKRPKLVAADRGMDFFIETGIRPDLIVGDFDSLSENGKEYLSSVTDTEIVRLKPEKDDSDTQSALNLMVDRGAKNILLIGCTGSRLDHVIANVELLVLGKERGVSVAIADAYNYVTLAENKTVLSREKQFGQYVSFFPIGGVVKDLTLTGFKYCLEHHDLMVRDTGLTVSNEIVKQNAEIFYKEGTLLMIQSRD